MKRIKIFEKTENIQGFNFQGGMDMKKYWIDRCIITPDGEVMPKGFFLTATDSEATIKVPSDHAGDPKVHVYYKETISIEQKTFAAKYLEKDADGSEVPVHIDDGELIGEPIEDAE